MMLNKKTMIGITGNTGSGKSTVSEILKAQGVYTINADTVAHGLMEEGRPAHEAVMNQFGTVNRKQLAEIVFNDIAQRTLLENILHPFVIEQILKEACNATSNFIAIDAVLLVESNLHKHCKYIWLITAPKADRLSRIIYRDGLTDEEANIRMRNQRDTAPVAEIAHALIYNDGDFDNLKSQIKTAWDIVRQGQVVSDTNHLG